MERSVVGRFCHLSFDVDTLVSGKNDKKPYNAIEETLRWIRLSFNFDNPVKKFQLDEDLFSHDKFSNHLFVVREDLNFKNIPADTMCCARCKCDSLIRAAEKKGINLFVLIAPDKYDIYENHIVGCHAVNSTLEYFSCSDKVINPKSAMRKAINNGVKDVYGAHETHCSEIGSRIMAEEVFSAIAPYLNDAF